MTKAVAVVAVFTIFITGSLGLRPSMDASSLDLDGLNVTVADIIKEVEGFEREYSHAVNELQGLNVSVNSKGIITHSSSAAAASEGVMPTVKGSDACCCKPYAAGSCFRNVLLLKEGYFCCKSRHHLTRSCDTTSGYTKRLAADDFLDSYDTYDLATCAVIPQAQVTEEGPKRAVAFTCSSKDQCPEPAVAQVHPDDWKKKPMICRGVSAAIGAVAYYVPNTMDVFQTVGLSSGKAVGKTLGHAGDNASLGVWDMVPEFGAELAAVAGPAILTGGVLGTFWNVLKLINGVCMDGWEFLATCGGVGMLIAVVMGTVALSLAFTGLGTPAAGLGMGLTGFIMRRVGPCFCEHGLGCFAVMGSMVAKICTEFVAAFTIENMSAYAAAVWNGVKAAVANIKNAPKMIATAAKRMANLFWVMLKAIGASIASFVKWALGLRNIGPADVKSDAKGKEVLRQKTCCALQVAQANFWAEISQVDVELVAEFNFALKKGLKAPAGSPESKDGSPMGPIEAKAIKADIDAKVAAGEEQFDVLALHAYQWINRIH